MDQLEDDQEKQFMAWINGPYNDSPSNLGSYDQALLFASGIGIAAQVPYIRELLELQPKQIFVVWEVNDECE